MKNIILEKGYKIETGVPISNSFALTGNERTDGLTDDAVLSLNFGDACWSKFYRGLSRSVTVELDGEYGVNGFEITFLHNKSAGIFTPRTVELYVSENGVDYMPAYTVESLVSQSDPEIKYSEFALTDAARYKARFIKLTFDVDVFAFAGGFKLFGDDADGSELTFTRSPAVSRRRGMRKREEGYSSTVIIYHGYWDSTMNYGEHYVKNTVDDLLPYVGYIGENGEVVDTMFDSVVFLLLQSRSPSGGKTVFFGSGENNATIKSDFECFAENLFLPGYNMDALNTAFGMVKKQLGLSGDTKLNVSVQLPFVYKTDLPFGDINDDGAPEYARTLDERLAIYEYYIDKIAGEFNQKCFENIELAAFYQGCEGVPIAMSDDERKLFRAVNDAVHARGFKATWIPCFLGHGFESWKELGFDFAYLQPNYMFHPWKKECLGEFAEIIDSYELGAEIEINHTAVNPDSEQFERDSQKYIDYLDYGAKCGYMHAALAFYQGAGPGSFYNAAFSKDSRARNIYDRTYRFIKEKYDPEKENLKEDTPMENINEMTQSTAEMEENAVEAAENTSLDITASEENAAEAAVEESVAEAAVKGAAGKASAKLKETAEQLKTKAAAAGIATAQKAKAAAAVMKDKTVVVREKAGAKAADVKKKTVETASKAVAKGKVVAVKAKEMPESHKMAIVGVISAFAAVICALSGGSDSEDQ